MRSRDQETARRAASRSRGRKIDLFIDNLLVRIHFIIVMMRWSGLAPWGFKLPFTGSLTSTFLVQVRTLAALCDMVVACLLFFFITLKPSVV